MTWKVALSIFWRNKRALVGALLLIMFALMATIGPELVTLDGQQSFMNRYKPISWEHPLGTDYAGRDVFAQIVHGSRDVLFVAFMAAVFTLLLGAVIGAVAGLLRGVVDAALMMIVNVLLTVPTFPLMLIIAAVMKIRDPFTYAFMLAVWGWGGLARGVRSQILSLSSREFIEAARVLGLSTPHIIFRELLPNITPFLAINFVGAMRRAITASVGIMLLGLVPFSSSNWGMMLNLALFQVGAIYTPQAIVYVLSPMGAIFLFQLAGLWFSHGLDEVLNPRLRG